jgi:hypothetical protein
LPVGEEKGAIPVEQSSVAGALRLQDKTWAKEKVSCSAKSPDGGLAAVGAYVDDIDFQRKPPMIRGARLHLVELNTKSALDPLVCYAVEKKEMSEKGERILSDCMFLGSWRYLAAVSGSDVFLWDTETGKRASKRFDCEMKKATLAFVRSADGSFLMVRSGAKAVLAYRIERKH